MKQFRVAPYDARSAINALHTAGIASEAVRWGKTVYLEVKDADRAKARGVLRPWLLLTWWERLLEQVRR